MLETPKTRPTDNVKLDEMSASAHEMDNQQAIRFGWMLGIIDGEGCFVIARQKSSGGYKLRPHFCLRSTDQSMLEEFVSIVSSRGVPCFIYPVKPRKAGYKPQGSIQIVGFRRVKRLVDLVAGGLINKRAEAELLKEWIEYRLGLSEKNPNSKARKLTAKDWNYRERLSQMKYSPERPRDYTLGPLRREDIVRPSVKAEEVASRQPAYVQ